MNHFSKKEMTMLVLLFIVVFTATFFSRTARLYQGTALNTDDSIELLLYERTNVEGLTNQLDSLRVEYNTQELIWAANTLGWRNYQPGRYVITGEDSYSSFLSKMGRGIQDPGAVTVLPGIDRERLAKRLSEQLRADSLSFRELFEDSSSVALELGLSGEELFARMLPDTYQMYWTSSPESVVRRLHSEFESAVIDSYKNEIDENPLSLNEIITLASIVEGEAQLNEEKPKISGLYLNRLDRGMLLQADPTVIYALGERRRLLYADYELDHPYNTYKIQGLPPGPITNPDLNSIRAVLNPENHDYIYMVATPQGGHRFSETYSEHQQASAEWREWIREQYRIRREREEHSSSSNL
ncbi:endolytic transglycosylase MltG [Rhodohalobacter sp. 614A]|uniref:endolytic transglycosylase MltG n=1 Tax=Rhodohalobacter sp. 614A TaxID=2908649 RepID=UPI001F25F7C9|nr:endolytic transglycosylase MltG [Rhodohalobacter sp. 614A]